MKKKSVISIFQVLSAVCLLVLFFYLVPWLFAEPISTLEPELLEKSPPPEWATYYTIGHGEASYFKDSPREAPFRAVILCTSFAGILVFIILSGKLYTRSFEPNKTHNNASKRTASTRSA